MVHKSSPADAGYNLVKPEMVVEISYLEYTPGGTLRHPGLFSPQAGRPVSKESAPSRPTPEKENG